MTAGVRRQHALANGGGFSETLAGTTPKQGIMVSRVGAEEVKHGVASPNQIDSYEARHVDELMKRGRYFGGWTDPSGPEPEVPVVDADGNPAPRPVDTYLDISERWPQGRPGREEADRQGAMNALAANNQLAGYDTETEGFPSPDPTLFPLEQNVSPVRAVYRNRNYMGRGAIFGEAARRAAAPKYTQTSLF